MSQVTARTDIGASEQHPAAPAAPATAAAVEALYLRLGPMLERLLTRNISAPLAVIEDACQFAWGALVDRRDEVVAGRELGWLLTTATREALRQLRAGRREPAVDFRGPVEEELATVTPLVTPDPFHAVAERERLAEIRSLPLRQQRILWLSGLGYEYHEIADETGDSRRTVERQLLRAKRKLAVGGKA
jgi:RNA polymerase sigma factor (sigma-70 family)